LKKPCDCILGVREANHGSGVGLFNRQLAERLGVPYVLLAPDLRIGDHPLVSLKFEELSSHQRDCLAKVLRLANGSQAFSLFLHTYGDDPLEQTAVLRACHVFCGNHAVYRHVLKLRFHDAVTAVFAPSLIPEAYRQTCSPGEIEFFYFGMANKIDEGRFIRLRDLLAELAVDYRLLCSLAVHQTSNGSCISHARNFLAQCFGQRFIFLGTLDDMGIAYFLHRPTIFVGFYKNGVRSNNTTFNTALQYRKLIITNIDADSPTEIQNSPRMLNIDTASVRELARFLRQDWTKDAERLAGLFTWERLLSQMAVMYDRLQPKVA
jgi:hypothetical protein